MATEGMTSMTQAPYPLPTAAPRPRARKSTGGVLTKQTKRGTAYAIRFRVGGARQYQHVGYAADGATREDAERAHAYALEQVRRGEWTAPVQMAPPAEVPTFHVAASDWFAARKIEGGRHGGGLAPSAIADLEWRLGHLLGAFARKRLDEIGIEDVDRFRRAKAADPRLNATSVNKFLATLAAILEQAVEYGHIERNPAAGKRRRLPAIKPRRTYLDRAEAIAALLDAAGEMDREGRSKPYRRALLATLTLAGLRIDECLSLRWRDVHLATGRLRVPGTKTAAAERTVDLLPLLRDELAAHAAQSRRGPDGLVFATSSGGKFGATNVRRRVLTPAVERANRYLSARDAETLPEGLTPHPLRRTFASVLYALG